MTIPFMYRMKDIVVRKLLISPYHKRLTSHIKKNEGLWKAIKDYHQRSNTTGCGYVDYWVLYKHIREHKPVEILECGTGVTTMVMAYALMENHKEGFAKGRITSMENMQEWYDKAVKLFPEELKEYADIQFSEKAEYCHSIFRGVGYKDVPQLDYDFVFVDGPGTSAPSDGTRSFDFDYINVVKRSTKPVYAIVDKRLGTCYVLQKLFGHKKVKYDHRLGLAFVGPCTKEDIRPEISGESFLHKLKFFGENELNLRMKY